MTGMGLADQPFDVAKEIALGAVAEGDGDAVAARAGGAADAMDVGLGFLGQVVIHDEADALDVDAARGDVGRDQDAAMAGAEIREGALREPPATCCRGWPRP